MDAHLRKALSTSCLTDSTSPQLRAIVLDYLCHNSYTNTARMFSLDSAIKHIDADGDEIMCSPDDDDDLVLSEEMLKQVEVRKEIRHQVLSGRVEQAIELLNSHFPTVLRESADTSTIPPPSSPNRVHFVAPTSVDPAHLSLNLRILAFIEACRTLPLEYKPPRISRRDTPGYMSVTSTDEIDPPPSSPMSPDPADPDAHDQHLDDLLYRIRKLYVSANALKKVDDRTTYLEELGQVGGLLAYKVPETSPMAKYLSQARREAVADQINSAILYRTGRPAISRLELHARYTTTLWSWMHDMKYELPPPGKWPPGVQPPPSSSSSSEPSFKAAMALSMKESRVVVPAFDLRGFLDTKSP